MTSTRILTGKIVAAHGIRGLVKVQPFVGDEALLGGVLFTQNSGDTTITVKLGKPMGNVWLASIEGLTDRNAAEALRGTELWMERNRLPTIEEAGTFYIADLIGLQVIDGERGEIGTVMNVDNFGAGDLLDVRGAMGDVYLPLDKDCVVDLAAKTIKVVLTGDWLEAK